MKKLLTAKWGIILLVIILFFLGFLFSKLNVFSFSEGAATYTLSPVENFFSESAKRFQNFFNYFGNFEKLENENNRLQKQISDLTSEKLSLQNELKNSEIVLSELNYINSFEYKAVIAKIISRGSDNYLQSLIINKGSNDGIEIGYPVTSDNGYLVGKIVEVNNYTSKVLLLNDIHSKISANISNELNSPGIVNGEFGLSLKLTLVPYDHEIVKDSLVVTSGLEQYIPGNLIIGKIVSIKKNEGELFQTADIDPIINYENLSILTVILPPND